jgi:hypothetical protein
MMVTDPGTNGRDPGDEDSSDHGGGFTGGDAMAAADDGNQAADIAKLISAIVPLEDGNAIGAEGAGTGDLPGDDDLLGALASLPFDHTLDQLTTSTDLFDVPALDFHDDLPT